MQMILIDDPAPPGDQKDYGDHNHDHDHERTTYLRGAVMNGEIDGRSTQALLLPFAMQF